MYHIILVGSYTYGILYLSLENYSIEYRIRNTTYLFVEKMPRKMKFFFFLLVYVCSERIVIMLFVVMDEARLIQNK